MTAKRCVLCAGPCVLLGVLGMLRWWRCRNCGMEQSTRSRRKP